MSQVPSIIELTRAHFLQGAYWGTAYAGYAMIYTPGYYVHTWNLRNGDLIQPLYVSCS